MEEIGDKINKLIIKSSLLLKNEKINEKDFLSYKSELNYITKIILENNASKQVQNIIEGILKNKVSSPITNPLYKWFYNLFYLKHAISFNAPYFIQHTISANYKKYIFWNKLSLDLLLEKI